VLNAIYRVAKWTQWPSEDGGNGHYYMVVEVPEGISWTQANEEALRALPQSHLATITSPEEDAFVAGLLRDRLPATGPTGAWVGAVQTAGAEAPDAGWRWTTDEPFAFTNWAPGEPNDWAYDEIYVEVYPRYPSNDTLAWNDCCGGAPINEDRYLYVVETPSLVAVTPFEVTVRTWPYWKVVGEVDVSTDTSLTVMVASGAPVDPTSIMFDTV
jgi:hypothetical protein